MYAEAYILASLPATTGALVRRRPAGMRRGDVVEALHALVRAGRVASAGVLRRRWVRVEVVG